MKILNRMRGRLMVDRLIDYRPCSGIELLRAIHANVQVEGGIRMWKVMAAGQGINMRIRMTSRFT